MILFITSAALLYWAFWLYYQHVIKPIRDEQIADNYENGIKSVSFLLRQKHGFKQAPYEEITKDQYENKKSKVKQITILNHNIGNDVLEGIECEGGSCPIK
jgi:hypothetical protein